MSAYDVTSETTAEQPTAIARTTIAINDIGSWLGKTYQHLAQVLANHQVQISGPPFATYRPIGDGWFVVEAGFPLAQPFEGDDDVLASSLRGGPSAKTLHIGRYEQMEPAYAAVNAWIEAHGAERVGDAWEVYLTDPESSPDPATWQTLVVQPYRVLRTQS